MQYLIRRTALLAVAALLAGCSLSSSTPSTPLAALNAPSLDRAGTARANRTSAIYSTHVTFAGPDGRRYTGAAVVFPKQLFPGLRVPGLAIAGHGAKPNVTGALSYYLEVPGVKGDSNDHGYQKWIDVDAFSIGYGPSKNNRGTVTDLSVDKEPDGASPLLLGGVFTGNFFTGTVPNGPPNVMELDVVQNFKGTTQKVMYFTFKQPAATSFLSGLTSAADGLSETATISFSSAVFCVIPINDAGVAGAPVCNDWSPTPGAE